MGKTLLVLRHAKSDWDAASATDHDRPLNARGRRSAATIGAFLAERGQVPELALCSSAVRARSTLELAMRAGDWETEVRVEPALYGGGVSAAVDVVASAGQQTRVLIVGHEPILSELIGGLVGEARVRFPTAALARVDFAAGDWAEVGFGGGELRWLVTPRLLSTD